MNGSGVVAAHACKVGNKLLDSFIVATLRACTHVVVAGVRQSIRFGQYVSTWQQQRLVADRNKTPSTMGMPAKGIELHRTASMPATKHESMPPPIVPLSTTATTPAEAVPEGGSDELDWAGSLNHAAVSSLHLGNALAMVRAGWLVPDENHWDDVIAALAAMDSFQARTDDVIGRVLSTMTEQQHVDFFEGFGDGFPTEPPDTDDQESL